MSNRPHFSPCNYLAYNYVLYSTEIICNIKVLFKKNKGLYKIVVFKKTLSRRDCNLNKT